MRIPLPVDTSFEERLRLFDKYLADKYARADAEFQKHLNDPERRAVLKAERAEVAIILGEFQLLFEPELRQP
jgi:hypothetical protein